MHNTTQEMQSDDGSLFHTSRTRRGKEPSNERGTESQIRDSGIFDDLFPRIQISNAAEYQEEECIDEQIPVSSATNHNRQRQNSSGVTDPFTELSAHSTSNPAKKTYSNNTETIDLGTGEVSISYSNDDDLRNSVINRMLDDRELANNMDTTTNRFLFSKLYQKYSDTLENTANEEDSSDFAKYNSALQKEELIKQKVQEQLNKKNRNNNNSNLHFLTRLDEEDLQNGFLNVEISHGDLSIQRNKNKSYWFSSPFKRKIKRERSRIGDSNSANPTNPFESLSRYYISDRGNSNTLNDGDSVKTRPIDDYVDIDDLPIELQLQVTNKKRQQQQQQNTHARTHHFGFQNPANNYSSSSSNVRPVSLDIDMIVSNEENLDYNFHRIGSKFEDSNDVELQPYGPGIINGNSNNRLNHYFKNPILQFLNIKIDKRNQIQRKLKVRHLHQIALGGTLGVGLLLSSGKAFSIAGPLGCLLGFMISGLIVLSTMLSFCEMVTLIPLCGGVSGVSSRFVDDAFGFALGVSYWLSYMIAMPTEITAASIMLSYYSHLNIPGPSTAGWITLFLAITIGINLFDIRVYGEFEYFSTLVKVLVLIILMIYMVILNTGGIGPYHDRIGFRYWDTSQSKDLDYVTYGAFRPTFDVEDAGVGSSEGIGGAKGRLCQVIVAAMVAAFAYVGTEIVILAGSESRNPRVSIPRATRSIYWRILIFYILAIFIISLNIYSGDPRLLRYFTATSTPDTIDGMSIEALQESIISENGGSHCETNLLQWAGFSNGNQSPFVIALQGAAACQFASATNAFLLFFALTAASSQLYASSRTLYFLAVQSKAPKIFTICSKSGVPYMSVLFTGLFGCLAYLSVQNNTALVFERFLSVCATTGLIVWSGMNLAFIRFYYGLKLRPDIIGRDDENYPYRSPFQPYTAYFGMICSVMLVILSGFVVYFKSGFSFTYFITSYGSFLLFLLCYVGYKIIKRTRVHRLDQLDLDSGRREIDRIIWEDERNYVSNFKEIVAKLWSFLF